MSVEAVQAVLERTVTDPSFRTRLFTEPDAALAEYELMSEENGAPRGLCVDASQSDTALDRRDPRRSCRSGSRAVSDRHEANVLARMVS